MGLDNQLEKLTNQFYTPHYQLYPNSKTTIDDQDKLSPTLTVELDGQKIVYYGNTNYAILDGKRIEFSSIIIYIDKNKTFYLPNQKIM